jgi:hypothetical protein
MAATSPLSLHARDNSQYRPAPPTPSTETPSRSTRLDPANAKAEFFVDRSRKATPPPLSCYGDTPSLENACSASPSARTPRLRITCARDCRLSPFGHSRAGACSRPDPEVASNRPKLAQKQTTTRKRHLLLSPQDTKDTPRLAYLPTQAHKSRVPPRALHPARWGRRYPTWLRVRPSREFSLRALPVERERPAATRQWLGLR